MKRILSSRGIEVHQTISGHRVVYIRYQHRGSQHLDQVGIVQAGPNIAKRQGKAVGEARSKLEGKRAEIKLARLNNKRWLHPKDVAEAEQEAADQERGEREELRLVVTVPRYLDERADLYARPKEHRRHFERLLEFFSDRYADEITRLDVREYHRCRREADGVFSRRGSVGPRNPDQEISALSAYFEWLTEAGHNLDNPCRGYKSKIRVKGQAYRPSHKAVIPTDEERAAIFNVDPPPPLHFKERGRKQWAECWQRNRAVWKLAYYLGGPRPESDLCRLRWRDVVFSDDSRARFGGGLVTFAETKTEETRTVPLHPEAEKAFRSLMPAEPDPHAFVFHKRRKPDESWDRSSYRRAWEATLKVVVGRYPRLRGMWFRDLRKAAVTDMRAAGTDAAIAGKVAGHTSEMSDHYTQATGQHARDAIHRLGPQSGSNRVQNRVVAQDRPKALQ